MATSSIIIDNVIKKKSLQTVFMNMMMFSVLQWLSQSMDLNLIEHLWDMVQWEICKSVYKDCVMQSC